MTGYTKRHTCKDGSRTEHKRYRCEKKLTKHTGPCISESVVEEYMLAHVYPELQHCIYEVKSLQQKAAKKKDSTYRIKAELDRLNILFQKGRITMEYYDEQYEKLEKTLEKERKDSKIITVESYRPIETKLNGNWRDVYEKLDYSHKKTFWKSIIEEIYIDKDTHKICGFKFLLWWCSKLYNSVEFEPGATNLEKEGKGYVVASLGTDSGYVPYTAFSAKQSYIDKNPKVIQGFTNALQKGMDYVQSHTPEDIAGIIAPQFKETDLDTITMIVERYYDQDTWKDNLVFEEDSFNLLQDILEDAGELDKRAPYKDLVTTDFADKAAK